MKKVFNFSFLLLVYLAVSAGAVPYVRAQDNYIDLPDSPSAAPHSSVREPGLPGDRETTWRTLPKNFLHDQKDIWLFPTQLARGHHWIPTLAVVGPARRDR